MFYFGLDLGKLRDYSAMAVVERRESGLVVRYLERPGLGTPFTWVVKRVRELTRSRLLNSACHLVVDATGLGNPVVEMLRAADLGCRGMTAVTITPGERARAVAGIGAGECWHVPRTDLLSTVQVMLERGELKIVRGMRESGALVRELVAMRVRGGGSGGSGVHDDLALAVSLACWQAGRAKAGMVGHRLPGI